MAKVIPGRFAAEMEGPFIQPEQYEAIYVNMPKSGLAEGGIHVLAVGTKETSRRRMGGDNTPAVPTPINPE